MRTNEPVCWVREDDLENDGYTHAFTAINSQPMSGKHVWIPLYREPVNDGTPSDELREAFEKGVEQGRKQERALWELTRAGEAIEPWSWPKSQE